MRHCQGSDDIKRLRPAWNPYGNVSEVLFTTPVDVKNKTISKHANMVSVVTEYVAGRLHNHAAIQISYSLEHPFLFYLDDQDAFEMYLVIVPSETTHKIISLKGGYHSILLDPLSSLGRKITAITEKEDLFKNYIKCILENMFLSSLGTAHVSKKACSAHVFMDKLIELTSVFPEPKIDKRIKTAMEKCEKRGGREVALVNLSRWIFLSKSRSYHLFRQETGIAFTKYLRWIKTLEAVRYRYNYRSNLTEAAHMAGFSDASHFSRSFKEMFGIPPSYVLYKSKNINCCC